MNIKEHAITAAFIVAIILAILPMVLVIKKHISNPEVKNFSQSERDDQIKILQEAIERALEAQDKKKSQ